MLCFHANFAKKRLKIAKNACFFKIGLPLTKVLKVSIFEPNMRAYLCVRFCARIPVLRGAGRE